MEHYRRSFIVQPTRVVPARARRPTSFTLYLGTVALLWLCGTASAQTPPLARDDTHWLDVPGTVSSTDALFPAASTIDPSGRVVAAFNVPPQTGAVFGHIVLARYDTLASQWTSLGGALRYQVTGAEGVVAKANGDVYVAGNFFEALNPSGVTSPIAIIARWDAATQQWDDLGGGLDGPVATVDEAPNGDICVGGSFGNGTNRDGTVVPLSNVGCFDGAAWRAFGGGISGFSFPVVSHVAVEPGGAVVVSGNFQDSRNSPGGTAVPRNRIARWNGSAWEDLGGGLNTFPFALAAGPGGDVYAAGFSLEGVNGGGSVSGTVLRWDGSVWSAVTTGLPANASAVGVVVSGNGTRYAVVGREIYELLAGSASWTAIGKIAAASFTALAAGGGSQDYLYAGGTFTEISGPPTPAVAALHHARWDGINWRAMDDSSRAPFDGSVLASSSAGGDLVGNEFGVVVGGRFNNVGVLPLKKLGLFDGTSWLNLGGGVSRPDSAVIRAVVATNPDPAPVPATIFVGGEFSEVVQPDGSTLAVSNVAAFSRQAQSWFNLGGGVDGPVHAIAFYDGPTAGDEVVYVGGSFENAINGDASIVAVNGIARFRIDDGMWDALGTGLGTNADSSTPTVHAIALARRMPDAPDGPEPFDHDVFVGGRFDHVLDAAGATVTGSANLGWFSAREGLWRPVGAGADSTVRALAYVRHPIWPMDSPPYTFNRGVLYAGGDFRVVRQPSGSIVPANHIAKWRIDTGTWSIIGQNASDNGVDAPVHVLTPHRRLTSARWLERVALVVGGEFTQGTNSDGSTVQINRAALLVDGEPLADLPDSFAREAFHRFGSGTDDVVRAATAIHCPEVGSGETVYFGGDFANAGGRPALGVAKWRYTIPNIGGYLAVLNFSAACPGCSASVTAPASSVCVGTLAKSHGSATPGQEIPLFNDLSFGASSTVDSDVPSDVPLELEIESNGAQVASVDSFFVESYSPGVLFVTGLDNPSGYAGNPEGRSTTLRVQPALLPQLSDAAPPGTAGLLFFNAVTDAPAVDILIDGAVAAESVPFGQPATGFLQTQAGSHAVAVRRSADDAPIASFDVEIEAGISTIVLHGFVDPSANQDGPPLDVAVANATSLFPTGVEAHVEDRAMRLHPNYPNPFSSHTTISFELNRGAAVRASVVDIIGRRVAVLFDEVLPAGRHARSVNLQRLPDGVYFLVLASGNERATGRMVIIH